MHTVFNSGALAATSSTAVLDLDGDELSYTEKSGAVLIDQGAAASFTTDLASIADVILTVSIDGMSSSQILSVRNQGSGPGQIGFENGEITYNGILIGEATDGEGGPLTITFLTADTAAISALLQNLTYEDTSDAPEAGPAHITIEFTVTDDESADITLASATVILTSITAPDPVQAEEDLFALEAGGSVIGNVKENDFDPDEPGNLDLFEVVSFNAGGTYLEPLPGEETINLSIAGVYGTLTLKADGTFTYTADHADTIPVGVVAADTFSYAIKAQDGSLATTTITFSVTGQPSFEIKNLDGDILTYPEGSIPLLLDTGDAAVAEGTLATFDGITLTVSVAAASGSELLTVLGEGSGSGQINVLFDGTVSFEGVEIGTLTQMSAGSLVVTFNEAATNTSLAALLHRLAYEDVSEAPTDKSLNLTLARGTTILSASQVSVVAQASEDDPVAMLDASAVTVGGTRAGQVTQNDFDPDSPGAVLAVVGFNVGSSLSETQAVAGTTIQGTYGALTLNADGTYTYIANNAGAIAPGSAEQDVFTYRVISSAGGEASTQLTIVVENPEQPILYRFFDFDADDLYYGEQSGPVQLDQDVSVTSHGMGWHGVKIHVAISGAEAGESIGLQHQGMDLGEIGVTGSSVSFSGSVIGTLKRLSAASLEIEFNGAASDENVTAVLRSLQYNNSREILSATARSINVSATIGGEAFGMDAATFRLEPVDDPLMPVSDAVSVMEEATISGNILVNDIDPDRPPPLVKELVLRGAAAGAEAPSSQDVAGPLVLEGRYGSLLLNQDGTFTYSASRAGDLIAGETANDVFTYRIRNDTGDEAEARLIVAVHGSDEIRVGSNFADVLVGGRGADQLSGLKGNDRLIGGAGSDLLKGGKGKDTFVFDSPRTGADTVLDFKLKEDKIHLLGTEFGLRPGKLKASAFVKVKGSKPKALDSKDRILYNKKKGLLYADLDGKGGEAPVLVATFKTKPDLGVKDFFII